MGNLRETFECGPSLRFDAQERMTALQFTQMSIQLGKIEAMMERLERRLWLTVYGVVGVVLAKAVQSFAVFMP
jgi:hypothetical protein